MYCDQCGKALQDSNIFCPQCGTKQEHTEISIKTAKTEKESKTKLDISWIFKSFGIFILTSFVVYFVIAFMLFALVEDIENKLESDVLILFAIIANLFIFFIGGFISAYLSPGVTLKEPAIAIAVLATLSNLLTLGLASSIVSWIIPYLIAYLGAKYGEKFQQKTKD